MMTIVWIVVGIIAAGGLIAVLRNYRRQSDYSDDSPGKVPEDYD